MVHINLKPSRNLSCFFHCTDRAKKRKLWTNLPVLPFPQVFPFCHQSRPATFLKYRPQVLREKLTEVMQEHDRLRSHCLVRTYFYQLIYLVTHSNWSEERGGGELFFNTTVQVADCPSPLFLAAPSQQGEYVTGSFLISSGFRGYLLNAWNSLRILYFCVWLRENIWILNCSYL